MWLDMFAESHAGSGENAGDAAVVAGAECFSTIFFSASRTRNVIGGSGSL